MPIRYELDDEHIALITIDRPETRNALDMYHFRDLAAAWRQFGEDDRAWVAIVTGVGRNFMSGADLETYIPQINANAPLAVQATKESVMRGLGLSLKEAYRVESQLAQQIFQSEDAKEGPRAFVEKRDPVWRAK